MGLQKSIDQLQGRSSATLYGTSYIMLREKKRGIVWQQPPSKELAAEVLIQPAGMFTELFIKVFTSSHTCFIGVYGETETVYKGVACLHL